MALKLLRPSVIRQSEWYKREERDPVQWKKIIEQVKQRDRSTCVYCGIRSSKFMMVNHIGAEDNHSLDNLELVCKPCHEVLHIGINAMNGNLSVISSDANQAKIVRETRRLVWLYTPWNKIEEEILKQFLAPNGKIYDHEESVEWANKILTGIPDNEFRVFLSNGLVVVFHEEGPWEGFPEAVHKWGMIRNKTS
jgi:HNH endonuclease